MDFRKTTIFKKNKTSIIKKKNLQTVGKELTLGSEAKYSIRTEGTSAKSVEHLVPVK